MRVMRGRGPNMNLLPFFNPTRYIDRCMVISDTFDYHIDPVRTEMTSIQHIPISQVCSSEERESKGIIADKNLF